jgi:hypothetical protein
VLSIGVQRMVSAMRSSADFPQWKHWQCVCHLFG